MSGDTSQPTASGRRILVFADRDTGLRAVLVIDGIDGRVAAGGTRTKAYPNTETAVAEAMGLAQAMTLKASIAGVETAGAKMVLLDHEGLDRPAAFRALGRRVEALAGTFYTAGDLGTNVEDLHAMAETTGYVTTREPELGGAVGRGVRACAAACAHHRGLDGLAGLRVAIQGCGAMGTGVAEELAAAGAKLFVADVNSAATAAVAATTGAEIVAPDDILRADVDIFAPCAMGGVLDDATIEGLRAWAVCGAANNVLAGPEGAERLRQRGILLVPDYIASAGALVSGICEIQGRDDAEELIEALGATTAEVLARSDQLGVPTTAIASQLAAERRSR